ncbi:hypothetical protein C8J57DRAFT_1278130 [Mycena rebaudengoi]|nr:hypothetical protein C8J57DRAFT_1278130 [Mycena rebaudengoi]
MVFVNFCALLTLTIAAVAVAGPVTQAPVVDSVNRNWHREATSNLGRHEAVETKCSVLSCPQSCVISKPQIRLRDAYGRYTVP